ncbi:MAG: 5'-nucleotidase C-terminal domain-containing protein, partial [Myxococcota bacterium]
GKLQRGKPESSLGNFAADAMREGALSVTGVRPHLCFTNAGGLRRDLEEGVVTEGAVVELMPFDNGLVVFDMEGSALRQIMDRLAKRGDPVSGVRYTTSAGRLVDVIVDGQPLDERRTYRVCTSDYVFEGGGQYPFEGAREPRYTGVLLRDLFIAAFERSQANGEPVVPLVDGRAKDVP